MALSSSPHLLLLMYLLSLAVIVGRATVNALGECYFPGVPPAYAAGYLPCDKYAVTSVCCMAGWTCFDNKLCIATDPGIVNGSDDGVELGTVMRGTCTNPEWDGEACGDFCLSWSPYLHHISTMLQSHFRNLSELFSDPAISGSIFRHKTDM